jgi:hypothetical protein
MRQVRQENAKLRQQIALAQQKKLINPVSKALNENKRLKATLVHGDEQISVVNKHTSNIGKGLAEKERLTKILHDIRHGGDTLLVDGEILDMRTHRLGKGLTENERLNKILYEIQNDKDTIIVRYDPYLVNHSHYLKFSINFFSWMLSNVISKLSIFLSNLFHCIFLFYFSLMFGLNNLLS